MIVLDTTVLLYAKGAEHPLREPCRTLLEAVSAGAVLATTTAEVLQEVMHVRARRRGRADAASLARDYADMLAPLLPVGEDALRRGLTLFERHPRVEAFDAVLAAASMDADAQALVSADAAFAEVAGLTHLTPDDPALNAIMATRRPTTRGRRDGRGRP